MPWGETISDFVTKRTQRQDDRRQRAFENLMSLVNTGKDVYSLLQEQNKFKPGSDYMNAQELMAKTWPQQNEQFRTGLERENEVFKQDLEKKAYDYKLQNPGKTAEQLTGEWLQTPEGQQYLQQGYSREDAKAAMEHKYRMTEIAASHGPSSQNRPDIKTVLEDITSLRPDWVVTDPATGQASLDVKNHGKEIQEAVLSYYAPADRQWASGVLAKTLTGQIGAQAPSAALPTPGLNNVPSLVQGIAGKYSDIAKSLPPSRKKVSREALSAETALESDAQSLIPLISSSTLPDAKADLDMLNQVIQQSKQPGALGQSALATGVGAPLGEDLDYRYARAFVDMLRMKYAQRGAPVPATGVRGAGDIGR